MKDGLVKEDTYLYWKDAAEEYYRNEQYDLAEGAVEKALSFTEAMESADAYLLAGNIYIKKEQYDRADIFIEMAISVSPDDWKPFELKGRNCVAIGYAIYDGTYNGSFGNDSEALFLKALEMYECGLENARKIGDTYGEGFIQGNKAVVLFCTKGLDEANDALTEAFRLEDPSGQASYVLELIDKEKQAEGTGSEAPATEAHDKADIHRMSLYMKAALAAKLYGSYSGDIDLRFARMFLESRIGMAGMLSEKHPEIAPVVEKIRESQIDIIDNGGVGDIGGECSLILERDELLSDVYYAVFAAGYIAFIDRFNRDRRTVNGIMKIIEDDLARCELYGRDVSGLHVATMFCAALWFANYGDFRRLVFENIRNLAIENCYRGGEIIDLSDARDNYINFMKHMYGADVTISFEDENNDRSVWDEVGALNSLDECADLAEEYYYGMDRIHDYKKAYQLAEGPAYEGNIKARRLLALMTFNGEGIPENRKEGIAMLHECLNKGDDEAKQLLIRLASNSIGDYDKKIQFLDDHTHLILSDADAAEADKEGGRMFIEAYREIREFLPIPIRSRLAFLVLCTEQQPEFLYCAENYVSAQEYIDEFEAYLAEAEEESGRKVLHAAANKGFSGIILLEVIDASQKDKLISTHETNWEKIEKYLHDKAVSMGVTIESKE